MAVTYLSADHKPYFVDRISRLQPDSERRFGTMDANQMMRHLRNALETAMGEVEMPGKPLFGGKAVYYLITHVMTTWPGGKIKAPDYWSPPADQEFEAERQALLAAVDRFVEHHAAGKATAPHPMLGNLTADQWARLHGLHFKHHFRQFGVE